MRFFTAIIFFFISLMCVLFYLTGMHGSLMFRTYMIEDWVIWGIAFVSFLIGIKFLIQGIKK